MSTHAYAVNTDRRHVSPITEDLLNEAVYAARAMAKQGRHAEVAAALEATGYAAELLEAGPGSLKWSDR